jgi:hypothetical protein
MTGMNSEASWLTLYREAVLEDDPKQLRARVAAAQHAIRRRARELWYTAAPDSAEQQQMDAAFYFLSILCTAGRTGKSGAVHVGSDNDTRDFWSS